MRTTRPSPLPDPERRPARAVRLYRGVLQHPPQAFGAGVSLPGCVREEVLHATGHDLTSYCPPNRGNSKLLAWEAPAHDPAGELMQREFRSLNVETHYRPAFVRFLSGLS